MCFAVKQTRDSPVHDLRHPTCAHLVEMVLWTSIKKLTWVWLTHYTLINTISNIPEWIHNHKYNDFFFKKLIYYYWRFSLSEPFILIYPTDQFIQVIDTRYLVWCHGGQSMQVFCTSKCYTILIHWSAPSFLVRKLCWALGRTEPLKTFSHS